VEFDWDRDRYPVKKEGSQDAAVRNEMEYTGFEVKDQKNRASNST
jgi:hypothetical protein